MKRRLIALVCALVLVLCQVPARAITVLDVYFTSVNDTLLPLTADTMPTWVGNAIYVPATVFDSNVTGVNLGVSCTISGNTVTLYNMRHKLVFDMVDGTALDQYTGEVLEFHAVSRNGRPYLPVTQVCDFFELEDGYAYTRHGYLVRIKSEGAVLTDERFVDAANSVMSRRVKEFLQNQNTQVPTVPPEQTDDPPQDSPVEQPKAQLCLAVRCRTGEGLEDILNELDRYGVRALFLFSPELMVQKDDLVRRAVADGHTLGILAEESNARQQLAQGNERLNHIARTASTVALVPDDQAEAFREEGWVCWRQTVNGQPREGERTAAYTQRMTAAVGTRRKIVYLTLDDSARMAQVIGAALSTFKENYTIVTPVETRL